MTNNERFEVLTAMAMKIAYCTSDVTLCRLVYKYHFFGGTSCLYLQER
jgi:hypothetical protein